MSRITVKYNEMYTLGNVPTIQIKSEKKLIKTNGSKQEKDNF